jgi:hypothetical protein
MYNGMIAPLYPFRFKAVEWYQGEYNVSNPEQYSRLLPGLMNTWRTYFGQPNLPFIIIQLPDFGSTQTLPVETGSWAELREAQLKSVVNDTSSRLVCTIDIGQGALHPTDKQDVGLRAAWAAANLVYGQNVVDECPLCISQTVSGTNMICSFTNIGMGLMVGYKDAFNPLSPVMPTNAPLANFALAGANGTYYAANAPITASNQVTVWSASVPAPLYVRYAWGNNPPCNLYNQLVDGGQTNGLPASPFRNDPVNKLVVNQGTGTGYYASNATVSITASNFTGETFDHWSSDTNFLSSLTASTVTATQAQEYVSVLANFRLTSGPTNLTAAAATGQVALAWSPMTAAHYIVKRSTVHGGPYTTLATNLMFTSAPAFTDNNVFMGVTYYYVVSATNTWNAGPNSAEVSATVPSAQGTNSATIWNMPGNYLWTCPAGVTSIKVECWGGGGAGGSGAFAAVTNLPVTPGSNYVITIPPLAGPVAGASLSPATNGGTVSFTGDNSTTVAANGGLGGTNVASNGTGIGGGGGAGGAATTGTGVSSYAGGNGFQGKQGGGRSSAGYDGGSGAGASDLRAGNGAATLLTIGFYGGAQTVGSDALHNGGAGVQGGTNGVAITTLTTIPVAGTNEFGPGGGGSRGVVAYTNGSPAASALGGNGGPGQIVITYTPGCEKVGLNQF